MSTSHSTRGHALLSASGANRWMNCTPSARLEEQYGEKETSVYAAEGTLAHEIAELNLSHDLLRSISDAAYEEEFEKLANSELFKDEMLLALPIYTDYCIEQFNSAKEDDSLAAVELEVKLDLTEFVPDSFGTADCVIAQNDTLEVIDLKYGKGVPVSAEWNSQLMLYGLGALRKYEVLYDFVQVRLTVVQPRLNSISSFMISVKELLEWAEKVVKPAAILANAGEGELSTGDWCRFCSVRNQCRKLYEKQIEIAGKDFKEMALLSHEEIVEVIKRAPDVISYFEGIVKWATERAVKENFKWPGLKLVDGMARRKWITDEKKVAQRVFDKFPALQEEDLYTSKLIGITEMTKLIGARNFKILLDDLAVKYNTAPKLVDESDSRPEAGIAQAQADFA
ncbi:MAG: DUF2800 domain-containing protein [Turicibacter sp.]|nr:DUF2800 domain-containing protein [Turicibacter sp.]